VAPLAATAAQQVIEQEIVDNAGALRPLRILAVDDDALVLMNTTAMLEDMGHRVIAAYSGREALKRVAEDDSFDLIITDHAMPQMTGAQLAKELRRNLPNLPILLATGYAELPSGEDPGLPRLSKPFGQSDLERAIESTVRRQ
jgi:CheY-like chemotaxis protein